MSSKILLLMVSISLVLSLGTVTAAQSNVAEENIILEIGGTDSLQGFGGPEVLELIKDSDIWFNEFTGIVSINNQEITFGTSNRDKLSIAGFINQINSLIIDLIKQYTDVSNVSDEQFKHVKSSLKIKSLIFQDSEKKISNFENGNFDKLKNIKNTKIVNVKKKDRDTFIAEARKKHKEEKQKVDSKIKIEATPYNFTQDELKESKEKANEKIKLKKQGNIKDEAPKPQDSKKVKSLVTIASEPCNTSSLNPHCGDHEDRLKQKTRFNDLNWPPVYSWIPTWVGASTFQVDSNTKKRGLIVRFDWDQSSLDNLRRDSNEAIEAEVLFYNYGPATGIPAYGYAYMYNEPYSSGDWSTNLPGGYKDTRFMDEAGEVSYAVGTRYVNSLQANTIYEFTYYAYPHPNWKDYTDVGLYQVNFQRGYWLDSTNLVYNQYKGTGDEWYIFNEENETTAKIKQYHKYNSSLYAPSVFNEYSRTDYQNQFRYKQTFINVINGSNFDAGYIPQQGYRVYNLTVDSPSQYSFKTSYNAGGPNSDTYLTLYNHDFVEVVSNDDSNGTLYSEIIRYLPSGDYYIVLRGYNWSAIQSNLSVTIQSSIGNEPISKGEIKYIDIPAGGSKSFAYSASSTGYSTFKTGYWQTSSDTYLYLYDSSNTLVSSNDDSNGTLYSTIAYYMSSGQNFRIEVKGYNGSAVKSTLWVE